MPLPGWIGHALRWLTVAVIVAFAIPTLFVASVLPYRHWDSLAFGAWSKSIAETGRLWANAGALDLSRPLFYVPQGLAWRFLGEGDWIGRMLSVSFGVVLAAALWVLAGMLTADRAGRMLMPPLALGVLLSSAVFAAVIAGGMTDVPVAASAAVTGAVLLSGRFGRAYVPLIALCAAATVLAKASGLLALAGLVPAVLLLRGRRAFMGIAGLAAGAGAALIYDLWQASRVNDSLVDFLRTGSAGFWHERGIAARWDAVERASWLGGGVRLIVLFGLVHALARVVGARPRIALAVAGVTATVWSLAGPVIADGQVAYPFDGSAVGIAAWLALVAAMIAAPFLARDDPFPRRVYAALLIWFAPTAIVWGWQRADEVRLLSPGWPALVLLTAAGLTSLSLALARFRTTAVFVPAAVTALLVLANLPSIDSLGRDGWRGLLELGPSGWSNRAAVENYAYGPFSYELNLARENVRETERIVSSDGRLRFFFPGQVEDTYAHTCAELEGARFFSFLMADESLVIAAQQGQATDPLGWLQCARPRLTMVGEQQGIYAAYVVGAAPSREPTPEDCHISSYPGELVDAVFADVLTYGEARVLRARASSVGFVGARIERTGCSSFRVVVTGVGTERSAQDEFRAEAESVGFQVRFAAATRYQEVPPDVAAVR